MQFLYKIEYITKIENSDCCYIIANSMERAIEIMRINRNDIAFIANAILVKDCPIIIDNDGQYSDLLL